MKTRVPPLYLVLSMAAFLSGLVPHAEAAEEKRRPNVVFILTDNHGAWTLGCYGNPDIQTPNIDRMAAEGILFNRAFANNAVCSPTRATYLTGLMPSQHGVHNFLRGGRLQTGEEAHNTLEEFTSLPEVLAANGYSCGLVGKWHLGNNLQPNEGLNDYWITMPHGGTSTFHGAQVIENGEIRKEPEYLTDFWTEHALKFIEQSQGKDQPFFLYLAYNGPYGLSRYQLESSGNRHAAFYADKDMPSFPRGVIHPWEFNNREYFGNPVSIRRYGEELSAIDDGVGAIMDKLKELGLDEDTLIVFTADQGWAGGQHGLWGMGDHTRPINALDYSMRIPLIFRQPNSIPGGRKSDLMTSNYDFMPSVLGYLGLKNQMPAEPKSPGRDYSAELKGGKVGEWDNRVFYEYETLRAVRTEDWKYVERYQDGYDELYHLAEDPEELHNLISDPAAEGKKAELKSAMDAFFKEYSTEKYNLWEGGESQPMTLVWGEEAKKRAETRAEDGMLASAIDPGFNPPPFALPDGLVAEVAAAPPLVQHPIMAAFDDRGRLFVSENAGLNLKKEELEAQKPNSIRVLEDTNQDGIFDSWKVFADGLTFPQGALWLHGSLYVMSPPSLWRFDDMDGDGIADERTELVTGFDYTGNAADVHGPFLHPNGRIYWCHGRKGHVVHDEFGHLVSENKGARIWSCNPDGSDLQVFAGGGMDNPVELDFTESGDVVGSVNLFYGRPRGDVLVHWLYGGAYPRHDQELVVAEFPRTGPLLPEFHNFGHVAVSGMCRYRSGALNPEWKDSFLVTHFNTQKITRTQVAPEGSSYRAVSTEPILEINSPDVHLTDVLEDANGDLLVLDTGGWFRIGCPTSQVAKPEIPGAIYRIRKAGAIDKKADPRGRTIDWEDESHESLAHKLDGPSFAIRERASEELAIRGEASLTALEEALASDSPRLRRNAIWTLTRMNFFDARELVRAALKDSDAGVRKAACHSAGVTLDENAVRTLAQLVRNDPSPAVVREAATSLGRLGKPQGVDALLSVLRKEDIDRSLEHAAIFALIEIGDYDLTLQGLKSGLPHLQARTLWALDQMANTKLGAAPVIALLDHQDEPLAATAIEIVKRHEEWDAALSNRFGDWLGNGSLSPEQSAAIAAVAPAFLATPPMQNVVSTLLSSNDARLKLLGLNAIANSTHTELQEDWIEPITAILRDDGGGGLLPAALDALGKVQSTAFDDGLRALGTQEKLPALLRVRALRAVANQDAALDDASFKLLTDLLAPDSEPLQQLEAAQMLGSARLNTAQLVQVAGLTKNAGPMALPPLLKAFERSKAPEAGAALAEALPQSPGIGNVDADELKRLILRFPPEVYEKMKPTLDEQLARKEQQAARLAELAAKLDEGDAERGREAFAQAKGGCIACHQIGGVGRAIGPNLSTIGQIRTKRDLLESILYPSESLARDFETYNVALSDGSAQFGLIQRETADTVYLTNPAGEEIPIPRTKVQTITPVPMSLMPQGLDLAMTQQDLLDLIAYLKSLDGAEANAQDAQPSR